MMIHRKKEHVVKDCNLYLENKCRYSEESCWFNHVDNVNEEDKQENVENVNEEDEQENVEKVNEEDEHGNVDHKSSQSVFQEVQVNLEPPIENI